MQYAGNVFNRASHWFAPEKAHESFSADQYAVLHQKLNVMLTVFSELVDRRFLPLEKAMAVNAQTQRDEVIQCEAATREAASTRAALNRARKLRRRRCKEKAIVHRDCLLRMRPASDCQQARSSFQPISRSYQPQNDLHQHGDANIKTLTNPLRETYWCKRVKDLEFAAALCQEMTAREAFRISSFMPAAQLRRVHSAALCVQCAWRRYRRRSMSKTDCWPNMPAVELQEATI